MSIIKSVKNLIGKDKTAEKVAQKHKDAAREAREEKKKEEVKAKKVSFNEEKGSIGLSIIYGPHISEKASFAGEDNKYVFKVYSTANKITIKDAVEKIYGVKVDDVNVVNIHPKTKMVRGKEGKKKGYKKAIVTLQEGQKIEL